MDEYQKEKLLSLFILVSYRIATLEYAQRVKSRQPAHFWARLKDMKIVRDRLIELDLALNFIGQKAQFT